MAPTVGSLAGGCGPSTPFTIPRREWTGSRPSGSIPFIDLAFGTFYLPRGRQPERFGILGEPVPPGLYAQLTYPFRG